MESEWTPAEWRHRNGRTKIVLTESEPRFGLVHRHASTVSVSHHPTLEAAVRAADAMIARENCNRCAGTGTIRITLPSIGNESVVADCPECYRVSNTAARPAAVTEERHAVA